MPSVVGLALGGIGWGASKAFGLTQKGPIGRAIIGAGIGGIAGAAQGYNAQSAVEGFGRGALLGAVGGAAIPALINNAGRIASTGYKGGKFLWNANMGGGARAAARAGMKPSFLNKAYMSPAGQAARGVGKAGMSALDHPLLVAGGVGALYGGGALVSKMGQYTGTAQPFESPTLGGAAMNVNYNRQAMRAAELGKIGGGSIGTPEQMQSSFEHQNWMQQTGGYSSANSRFSGLADSTTGLTQGLHAGRHG